MTFRDRNKGDMMCVFCFVAEDRARAGRCDGWPESEEPGGEVRGRRGQSFVHWYSGTDPVLFSPSHIYILVFSLDLSNMHAAVGL